MAFGSNLSQTLISNTDVRHTASGLLNTITYTSGVPEIGIWDVDGNDFVGDVTLFETTVDVSTALGAPSLEAVVTVANPLWKFKTIQFVQSTDAQPGVICTPIIHTSQIKSIHYQPNKAAVARELEVTPPAHTAGDSYNVKFVIRKVPTSYSSFEDPASGLTDLTGANKVFPLGFFNNTHHKVINLEIQNSEMPSDDLDGLVDRIHTQVEANATLDALMDITDNGATFDVTARHAGVFIDCIVENTTANTFGSSAVTDDYEAGTGNGWQVLQDEKRCRYKQGNMNRMYFPDSVTQFANTSYNYDKITITYGNPNWPNGAGIAPAGSHNQVVLYYTDTDGTAPGTPDASTNTFDSAFGGYTIGTAVKYDWY